MVERKYSVVIKGRTYGPFGTRRLQEFVDRGQIEGTTLLTGKRGDRVPASAIPGLRFPERYGQLDAADPELVKRFSSAPRPYPVAPPISAPEETWPYAEEFDPEATAILRDDDPEQTATFMEEAESTAILTGDEEPTAILMDVDPEPTVILRGETQEPTMIFTEEEPEPTAMLREEEEPEPTALDLEQQPALEGEDKTVMQAVDYEELESKFAASESARVSGTDGSINQDESPIEAHTSALGDEGTRRCPYCDEKIQKAALKCRWCKEYLPADNGESAPGQILDTARDSAEASELAGASTPSTTNTSGFDISAGVQEPRASYAVEKQPGEQQYTCPCCTAMSPNINFEPEQRRIICRSCGFTTESTYASPPSPTILATALCSSCRRPTRYIASTKLYHCDACRKYVGGEVHRPNQTNAQASNMLGKWAWFGIAVFTVGCVGLLTWLLVREPTNVVKEDKKGKRTKATPVKKREFQFNLPQKAYLGKTTQDLRKAFPNAVYENLTVPFKWGQDGKVKFALDGYLREGRCTTGGCHGNCWRQCLYLFLSAGRCVMVRHTTGLWVNPNGGTPWGSKPLGKYLKKSLLDVKPVSQTWKQWSSPDGWDVGQMEFDTGEYRVLFNLLGSRFRKNPEGFKHFETISYTIAEKSLWPSSK